MITIVCIGALIDALIVQKPYYAGCSKVKAVCWYQLAHGSFLRSSLYLFLAVDVAWVVVHLLPSVHIFFSHCHDRCADCEWWKVYVHLVLNHVLNLKLYWIILRHHLNFTDNIWLFWGYYFEQKLPPIKQNLPPTKFDTKQTQIKINPKTSKLRHQNNRKACF